MKKARTKRIYRQLIAASLLAGGTFQLAAPVLALTPAGTGISNTATATYQDPTGTTIDATSNTVEIKVAEVAGITVTPNGTVDPNGGTVTTGDTVYFDYKITNTGNDPTQFFIPGAPSQIQGGTAGTIQITEYDPDGPTGPIAPVVLATPINVPAGGSLTGALSGTGFPAGGSIPAGASLTIRVPVTVTANTSGAPIKVVMGDTPPNDNSAATQNQAYTAGTRDIYTQDNADPGGTPAAGQEQNGAPQNGVREASAFQETFLAAIPKAFATILKTNTFQAGVGAAAPNGTITYELSLDVAKSSPDTGYIAAPLKGSDITVNGSGVERVLVSDVVPTGTTLVTPISTVGLPSGWTPVYSASDPTTGTALQAQWFDNVASVPGGAAAIKRIGFIYNAGTAGITNGDGVEVTGLKFQVTTSAAANTTIYNLGQVFGQTTPDADTTPGNDTDPLVYDESGDNQPNNYDGANTPGTTSNLTPTQFNTNPTDSQKGIATAAQGVDDGNNNTGTGPGGEVNPLVLNITPPNILNGPQDKPSAVGPTDNNDDFTNLSVDIPPANSVPGSSINPPVQTFTNTVNNPGTTALNNVLIRPLAPADNTTADIPVGTTVTITLGANQGVYTFDGTNYNLTSGTPVSIPVLTPGQSLDYTVKVDLPSVPLSTDDTDGVPGFPVRIVAFTDNDGSGTYNTGDNGNETIDRIYTGYLKLIKEARILDSTGAPVSGAAGTFTTNGTVLNPQAVPGNRIEYRIRYKNISDASAGSGNSILNANTTTITEDGTAGGNTWFGPTKDPVYPGNPVGSATATSGTIVITDSSGDIKIYTNNVGSVVPSGATGADDGNLTFQRLIK